MKERTDALVKHAQCTHHFVLLVQPESAESLGSSSRRPRFGESRSPLYATSASSRVRHPRNSCVLLFVEEACRAVEGHDTPA